MGLFPLGLKSVRRLFVYLLGVLNISMNLGLAALQGFFFFFFFLSFGASLTLLLVFGLFVEFFWGSG